MLATGLLIRIAWVAFEDVFDNGQRLWQRGANDSGEAIMQSKRSGRLLTTALGLLLLATWVVVCSFAFWWLLKATPEGITSGAVQALAWPFATILLVLPILAIALLGGMEMLRQVVSLKDFLGQLPAQVEVLDDVAKRFESSRDLIADAAAAVDQSTSQLADLEARVKRRAPAPAGVAENEPGGIDIVAALSQHLETAKSLFDAAAVSYEQKNKQGITRARGWILPESVNELIAGGYLNERAGRYVDAVLNVDRRTRRSGRSNLSHADIDQLNSLEP